MRKTWGMLCVVALVGCASQSGSTQQTGTTPAESTSAGGDQAAPQQAAEATPERQDAIERAFERKTTELNECWTKEYEKTHDRKLEGDLTIGMDVQPSGQPANVRILKSSIGNHDIESCVTQTISQWAFPEGNATVPYMRTVHLGSEF